MVCTVFCKTLWSFIYLMLYFPSVLPTASLSSAEAVAKKKKKSNKKKNNQQQKSPCSIFYFSLSPADGDGTRTPYVKVYYSFVVYLLPYHCKEKVTQSAIFSFFTSNYFRFFYLIYIQIYIYIYIYKKKSYIISSCVSELDYGVVAFLFLPAEK